MTVRTPAPPLAPIVNGEKVKAPYNQQQLGGTAGGSVFLLAGGCTNCHSQVHGSNHPSGAKLMR